MKYVRCKPWFGLFGSALIAVTLIPACSSGDNEELQLTPIYNQATGRATVQVTRDLEGGEKLFMRVRRGSFGALDCKALANETEALVDSSDQIWFGPVVDTALTKSFYGPEWASNPTPEMLAKLKAGTDSIIDACLMDGTTVVKQIETDLFQAWDTGRQLGINGKADDTATGEQAINSAQQYGVRCVAELGEIPFFNKVGDQDYGTYDCLNSTPIPMTVTDAAGAVANPSTIVNQCDNPQYIYSLCEPGPRVATKINEQGTRWVLLCRKSIGGYSSNQYNDIAMIGNNPFTGKTCFFQNALYQKTDGSKIPHPADKVKSTNLWDGVHGGLGNGIQCARCHDSDAYVHTPWIDGAKDSNGRPVVPKMGVDADYPLGANETPYSLINAAGQRWTLPKQITSPEANKCLTCHRIGDGIWSTEWMTRMNGTDSAWTSITTAAFLTAQHKYWMPPGENFTTDASFGASEFAKAFTFIQNCAKNPTAAGCTWKAVPTTIGGGNATGGKLRNPVTLSDTELATKASTIIGVNRNAQSNVCSECHAATEATLRDWSEKTMAADRTCLSSTAGAGTGSVPQNVVVDKTVTKNQFVKIGEYDVAAGSSISVKMSGAGDADLYVKRGAEVTTAAYDCRPYASTSTEKCDAMTQRFTATGPAKFYVAINGFAASSTVKVEVAYASPGTSAPTPLSTLNCLRLDPTRGDSPFAPAKAGIYAAAAHLGWFQDTFKSAYPVTTVGNTLDTWTQEYAKFITRVSMPKGNHPRLTQDQFDVVAEWFARGLPQLAANLPLPPDPNACVPSVTPEMTAHVSTMATQGWKSVNRDAGLSMFGCNGVSDSLQCLASFPRASATAYGDTWEQGGSTLRVLRELSFHTYYWMRSSPDGRFVANGQTGGAGSMISDLQTNKDIPVSAAYDPGFFPDNRGWVFQGTPIGAAFCSTSLLTSGPAKITFAEPQCKSVEGINLYQHLGAAVGGGDYFVINGQFTSDNPTRNENKDPFATFGNQNVFKITPMIFDGTRFTGKPAVTVASPFEGDNVLSPSSRLVVSRIGATNGGSNYVVRKINATPNGNSYNITAPEVARYCTSGAKPAVSYDEKFMVIHHYEADATANIKVISLATGAVTQITKMKPGQRALFPHFRSDGWIYFLVRDSNSGKEYAMASDAALRL
jgi:hypothetical protein